MKMNRRTLEVAFTVQEVSMFEWRLHFVDDLDYCWSIMAVVNRRRAASHNAARTGLQKGNDSVSLCNNINRACGMKY